MGSLSKRDTPIRIEVFRDKIKVKSYCKFNLVMEFPGHVKNIIYNRLDCISMYQNIDIQAIKYDHLIKFEHGFDSIKAA